MSDTNNAVIVEISDIGLRASQAGAEFYNEPGIAFLPAGQSTPVLGHLAQQSLRQQPTRIHSRYWSELSTDALQINDTNIRHSADLVWHQINQIKSSFESQSGLSDVCICTPSNISQQQMQLLTGICQSLDFQVGSLINLGLAQLAGCEGADISGHAEITHIDLQLHQLVLSRYINANNSLEFKEQEVIQDISFLRLLDRLLHLLRDKFIQNSRFDPLHSGDTEQQLFDQLMRLIETGEHAPFKIDTPQKQHKIELGIQELESQITSFKTELVDRLPTSGLRVFTPAFSSLPGFSCTASELKLSISTTTKGVSRLLAQQQSDGATDGTIYINRARLGSSEEPVKVSADTSHESTAKSNGQTAANALLFNHQVYTKNSLDNLTISGVPNDIFNFSENLITLISNQVTVNNAPPSINQQLFTGDRVKAGEYDLLAVRIADS